jgi:hypothetical protein
VIKEVKVLQPYKVPYKVHVPYFIHQEIHKIPVHKHPVHTSEHIHHPAKKVEIKEEEESKSSSFSHSASQFQPIYVSHSPVGHSFDSPMPVHHMKASERVYSPEITSLNTKIEVDTMGFGSQEGQMADKEDDPWAEFEDPKKPEKPKRKERAPAVPYPFPQEQIDILSGKSRLQYDHGYHPSSFDFVSFH